MLKGVIRFVAVWLLSWYLTPYLDRAFLRLAARAPRNGLVEDVLVELSGNYSAVIIRTFFETLGDLVFGSKKK